MRRPSFRNRFLPAEWRDGLSKGAIQQQLMDSPFVKGFVDVYHALQGFRAKRQHLSMFAPHFSYKMTSAVFGIGRKLVYFARVHAGEYGGARPVPPSVTSYRISPEAAEGVNAFVSRRGGHAGARERARNAQHPNLGAHAQARGGVAPIRRGHS